MRLKSWKEFFARCRARWRLARRQWTRVRVRVERPRGLVGLFVSWRRRRESVESEQWKRGLVPAGPVTFIRPVGAVLVFERDRFDLWACLVPFLPLHLSWRGPVRRRAPKWNWIFQPPAKVPQDAAAGAPPPVELTTLTPALVN